MLSEADQLIADLRTEVEILEVRKAAGRWGDEENQRAQDLVTGPLSRLLWKLKGEQLGDEAEEISDLKEELASARTRITELARDLANQQKTVARLKDKLEEAESWPALQQA